MFPTQSTPLSTSAHVWHYVIRTVCSTILTLWSSDCNSSWCVMTQLGNSAFASCLCLPPTPDICSLSTLSSANSQLYSVQCTHLCKILHTARRKAGDAQSWKEALTLVLEMTWCPAWLLAIPPPTQLQSNASPLVCCIFTSSLPSSNLYSCTPPPLSDDWLRPNWESSKSGSQYQIVTNLSASWSNSVIGKWTRLLHL